MKTKQDWFLYIKLCFLIGLVGLINFEGTVIASLSYILTNIIIQNTKN